MGRPVQAPIVAGGARRPGLGVALAVVAVLGQVGGVGAQHPTRGRIPPEAENCVMCHGPHAGGPAGSGATLAREGEASLATAELDPASRACLRCHESYDRRARQPEFAGGGPGGRGAMAGAAAGADGAFLGVTLLDHHPMGPVRGPAAGLGDPRIASWPGDVRSAGAQVVLPPDASHLGCTACHDPHARTGGLGDRLEAEVCGGCHVGALPVPGHPSLTCSDCHRVHAGKGPLLQQHDDLLCRSCHGAFATRTPRSGPLAVSRIEPGHVSGSEARCVECHPPHAPGGADPVRLLDGWR